MSPELASLATIKERGSIPWDYVSNRPGIGTPTVNFLGVWFEPHSYRLTLKLLKDSGLISPLTRRGSPGASYRIQKSLTVYCLTPAGHTALSEAGL